MWPSAKGANCGALRSIKPFFYGPYQAHAIVLETMDSYEVGKSMKKLLKKEITKGLSVISEEQVIKAVETLLSESK